MTPAGPSDLRRLLKTHFGYDEFRGQQERVIANALRGRHGVVIMPTGGGKSLCYQLPALALPGLTLVVSPLIALMKDQVDGLRANGIAAEFVNSSLDAAEVDRVQRDALAGRVKILYAAPERVSIPGFQRFLERLRLSLIAIDEAHCISEWGHDFRPDYRNLAELRRRFPATPVMALTATATGRVRSDIVEQLALSDAAEFIADFDRPNLTYDVRSKQNAFDTLLNLLDEQPGAPAIVYCFSRADTEELAARLTDRGHPAAAYHAGLEPESRRDTQERFIDGVVPIVVATIAFGMGIDKPDVRLVVHHTIPKSIEAYYQETGRAGRDGQPSRCVLLFSEGDRHKHEYFIRETSDAGARATAERQLAGIMEYSRLHTCRRRFLLAHFGQTMTDDACGNCDVCLAQSESVDVTVAAQKLLSAAIRTGERFGAAHLCNVLLGRNMGRIRELGHDQLSVFGIVTDYDGNALRAIAAQLVEKGLLARSEGQYATLAVTPAGRRWLKERAELQVNMRIDEPGVNRPGRGGARAARDAAASGPVTQTPATPEQARREQGLFEELRTLRRRLADEQGWPAFTVFNDATLREMSAKMPADEAAMLRLSGVGPAKIERYGAVFLDAIRQYAKRA